MGRIDDNRILRVTLCKGFGRFQRPPFKQLDCMDERNIWSEALGLLNSPCHPNQTSKNEKKKKKRSTSRDLPQVVIDRIKVQFLRPSSFVHLVCKLFSWGESSFSCDPHSFRSRPSRRRRSTSGRESTLNSSLYRLRDPASDINITRKQARTLQMITLL